MPAPYIIAGAKFAYDNYGPGRKGEKTAGFGRNLASQINLDASAGVQKSAGDEEYDRQKELAMNGLQWRIEDARRAGIHPLYASGMQGASYTPQASMGSSGPDTSGLDSLLDLGQNIGRAAMASQSKQEKTFTALQIQQAEAQLDGQLLDNHYRAYQLSQVMGPPGTGPGIPGTGEMAVPGQGDSGFKVIPSESTASKRTNPGVQKGEINSTQIVRNHDGTLTILPSKDAKERMEDDVISEMMWHLKNRIWAPEVDPKEHPLPKGKKRWFWNPFTQQYSPR